MTVRRMHRNKTKNNENNKTKKSSFFWKCKRFEDIVTRTH